MCESLALTTSDQAHGQVLTAADLRATNRVEQPSRVVPTALAVHRDGRDTWRVELPRHPLASVVLRPWQQGRKEHCYRVNITGVGWNVHRITQLKGMTTMATNAQRNKGNGLRMSRRA